MYSPSESMKVLVQISTTRPAIAIPNTSMNGPIPTAPLTWTGEDPCGDEKLPPLAGVEVDAPTGARDPDGRAPAPGALVPLPVTVAKLNGPA